MACPQVKMSETIASHLFSYANLVVNMACLHDARVGSFPGKADFLGISFGQVRGAYSPVRF